jgi:Bacterial PH domain
VADLVALQTFELKYSGVPQDRLSEKNIPPPGLSRQAWSACRCIECRPSVCRCVHLPATGPTARGPRCFPRCPHSETISIVDDVEFRRGHGSTRLTARGIEIRRYRRKLVPWEAIRDIETISYDRVADVPVANERTRIQSPRGRGPRTVAAVQIVRTSGHRIQLPAPLVTRSKDDPGFEDKVQMIKARWRQAVTGATGHPY